MEMARNLGVHFYILECICSDEIAKSALKKDYRKMTMLQTAAGRYFKSKKTISTQLMKWRRIVTL